jgi:hypothetical protein
VFKGGSIMVEILIFILIFLGIAMIEGNLKKMRKQNEEIISLLRERNK